MQITYQIIISSFYKKFLNFFLENFKKRLKIYINSSFFFINIIRLPKQIKKFTVLRSPHVNKKSKEQFGSYIHKILINLKISNNVDIKIINAFLNYFKILNIGKKKSFLPIQIKIKQKVII